MRSMGNYYSEWADARGDTRRTLLATFVACAVGATASAAVIFSLSSSSTTQSGVPPISPRAIVRNVAAPESQKPSKVDPRLSQRVHRRRQCGTLVLLRPQKPSKMSPLSQRRSQQRTVWCPPTMSR